MTSTGTPTTNHEPAVVARPAAAPVACEMSRHAVFAECPQCGGGMAPEHAHYRCGSCGWRDSCCD